MKNGYYQFLLLTFTIIFLNSKVNALILTKGPNSNSLSTKSSTNNHNNNHAIVESEQILSSIVNQTEKIKNEICSSINEISSALTVLVNRMKNIKQEISMFHSLIENKNQTNVTTESKYNSKEKIEKILHLINNMNLIKVDLFKINEILINLQKVNCENQGIYIQNIQKEYQNTQDTLNKLIELLQEYTKKDKNFPIDLVILN